jgi:DNA-binding GntR family transcriptional regulator
MVLDRLVPIPAVDPRRPATPAEPRATELRRGNSGFFGGGRARGGVSAYAETAVSRIFRNLRSDIVIGTRPGGSRLVELPIARDAGVSRHTVRMAIQRLVSERLVDESSALGWRVASFTRSDAADLAEVQSLLDRIAARQAAHRRTGRDLGVFRRQSAAAERALQRGDDLDLIRIGGRFRAEVYASTGNGPLLALHDQLFSRSLRLLAFADDAELDPARALADFDAAFVARDADAAERAAMRFNAELRTARRVWALRRLDESTGGFGRELGEPIATSSVAPHAVDRVVSALRAQILSGARAPGQPLPTRALADIHGTGRAEVRRAIGELAKEGLVTVGSAKLPARVRDIPLAELAGYCELGALLDLLAVRFAAERSAPEALATLESRIRDEERLLRHGAGPDERDEAALAFRAQLHRMSGNRVLLELARTIEPRLRVFSVRAPGALSSLGEHRLVLEAIASRDFELLERRRAETDGAPASLARLLRVL